MILKTNLQHYDHIKCLFEEPDQWVFEIDIDIIQDFLHEHMIYTLLQTQVQWPIRWIIHTDIAVIS